MNATLEEGRCDVVMGVPEGYDLVSPTKPYYRSTYVFVYPKDKGPQIKSLDDPVLKKIKIGVHLLGDDYTNPPPVHELSKRGVVGNLVGFSTFYSADNPPSAIIDAVASGKVGVAIVWGPAAGYFVKQQTVPLAMVPVPSGSWRSAVRVRHLDGRQAGQRCAEESVRESHRYTTAQRSRRS